MIVLEDDYEIELDGTQVVLRQKYQTEKGGTAYRNVTYYSDVIGALSKYTKYKMNKSISQGSITLDEAIRRLESVYKGMEELFKRYDK